MPYQVAIGFGNTAGLADISPEPASPNGVQWPAQSVTGDGNSEFIGFQFMDLVWNSLERSDYNSIRTQFGFTDVVASKEVTVRIRFPNDLFAIRNAIAIQQITNRRGFAFWQNLIIRLKHIQTI